MGLNQKSVNYGEYIIFPIETNYIKPNDSLDIIINKALDIVKDKDCLVIAETPISISQGRIVDEANYSPSLKAKFLAFVWSKYIWGYVIGPLLRIKKRTIKNLRKLPSEASQHKEVVLQLYGWKHALKPCSEAGIDLSNVPGTYVSLLPENPEKIAKDISKTLKELSKKDVNVLIVDTDATYKIKDKYFTGLSVAIPPIKVNMGVWAYMLGQISKNCGSTPIASSSPIDIEEGLKIANICEEYQKSSSGNMETIHDMKRKLCKYEDISVDDLDSIVHTPAIVVRKMNL
ncbi:MAG: coenzyme F420-0:L-glutamate ligase [Methanobrevibacter sp.]|jgi:F420-0:gamma-glutamyl ligase-like protein|nr:coenzyme F420-0:L-glutamate ligase [Candidatus Methanovirga basalitermitum]